jgi:hypothetical protein
MKDVTPTCFCKNMPSSGSVPTLKEVTALNFPFQKFHRLE